MVRKIWKSWHLYRVINEFIPYREKIYFFCKLSFFLSLLLCKINFLNIFYMIDFFQIYPLHYHLYFCYRRIGFSSAERKRMVNYLIEQDAIRYSKGLSIWKRMVDMGVRFFLSFLNYLITLVFFYFTVNWTAHIILTKSFCQAHSSSYWEVWDAGRRSRKIFMGTWPQTPAA